MGNTVYSEKTHPTQGINTSRGRPAPVDGEGRRPLLTAPTLGAALQRAGMKFAVFSAGSSGSALLLNHRLRRRRHQPGVHRSTVARSASSAAVGVGPKNRTQHRAERTGR
jgi:hypothetical protein